ncbi:MAG: V4R domain-containing protein [Thermoplasmata archaeon]
MSAAHPANGTENKQVAVYFRRPGREAIHITFVIGQAPGTLMRVLQVLPTPAVNMLHIQVSHRWDGEEAVGHIYAETDGTVTAPALEMLLSKVPCVKKVRVETGKGDLLVDSSYPLRIAQGPGAMLLVRKNMAQMLDEIRAMMGTGGSALLYEQGVRYGEAAWVADLKMVGAENARTHLPYVLQIYSALGWGRLEVAESDLVSGRARVLVHDGFECASRSSPTPYSQFLRGHLAGYFSVMINAPVSCKEVRCLARGDPVCEFELARNGSAGAPNDGAT